MDKFNTIYTKHYLLLFNVANKMVNDKDAASDIVQEVFVSLYKRMKQGVVLEYPKSWLYRAVMNKCVDETRRNKKFLKIEDSGIEKMSSESDDVIKDKQALVQQALSRLSLKERSLAILYSEGFSYKEIAEVTQMKLASVGKTLARTIEKLGKHLKEIENELH